MSKRSTPGSSPPSPGGRGERALLDLLLLDLLHGFGGPGHRTSRVTGVERADRLHEHDGRLLLGHGAVLDAAGHHVELAGSEDHEAESRLLLVAERLRFHLEAFRYRAPGRDAHRLAVELRELLDARVRVGLLLREAAAVLHSHPTHLIRCFTQTYGLPPHTYLTGKRIELARGLLLDGQRPAGVATSVGFHDEAHLNRHFTRHVGVTPARYAAGENVSRRYTRQASQASRH